MKGETFLKKKYQNLSNSEEVNSAVRRKETKTGEKINPKPETKIQTYLERFEEICNEPDVHKKYKKVKALKQILFRKHLIKSEDIPERVYELEQELALEMGYGHIEITDRYRREKNIEIITGQKDSLSEWIDYLTSYNAQYPMWAKYWAMNSMLKLGKYNKQKKRFDKRGKNSVSPYPTCNAYGIGKAIEVIEEKIANTPIEKIDNYTSLSDTKFKEILKKEDFGQLYAAALESLPEYSEEGLKNIEGEWVRYERNSDPKKLYQSLQGYPLEWCTAANINTAATQLRGGDFYVYYSQNKNGNNTIPRVAIRMYADEIEEVRGIEHNQEMDPYILPVVEEKMQDFGEEGEVYKEKSKNIQRLKTLRDRSYDTNGEFLNPKLTPDDLLFMYQIEGKIRTFSHFEEDDDVVELHNINPLITKLLLERDYIEDANIILQYLIKEKNDKSNHDDEDYYQDTTKSKIKNPPQPTHSFEKEYSKKIRRMLLTIPRPNSMDHVLENANLFSQLIPDSELCELLLTELLAENYNTGDELSIALPDDVLVFIKNKMGSKQFAQRMDGTGYLDNFIKYRFENVIKPGEYQAFLTEHSCMYSLLRSWNDYKKYITDINSMIDKALKYNATNISRYIFEVLKNNYEDFKNITNKNLDLIIHYTINIPGTHYKVAALTDSVLEAIQGKFKLDSYGALIIFQQLNEREKEEIFEKFSGCFENPEAVKKKHLTPNTSK